MKIKTLIMAFYSRLKTIEPIRIEKNANGVEMYYYIIDNKNLKEVINQKYYNDFKVLNTHDLEFFLKLYSVCIAKYNYQIVRFLNMSRFELSKKKVKVEILTD